MKLITKKYVSFFTACLVICFVVVSFFGIHSRWGYTINNHIKGWQNLRFGFDFDNHIEMTLSSSSKEINLDNEKIIKTIQNRLNYLGFTDNKLEVDPKENLLTLKFTQPAGKHEFDMQTVTDIVSLKGDLEITSSKYDLFPAISQQYSINRNDIKSIELLTQKDEMQKNEAQKQGVKIQLNAAGSKKLANLTNEIVAKNKEIDKQYTNNSKEKPKNLELEVLLNGLNFYSKQIFFPITDGCIEIFKDSDFKILKQNLAYLKNPELPVTLTLKSLRSVSPEVGMWFKRGITFSLMLTLLSVFLILTIKFKLIGLVCGICFAGHLAFILDCFTGFFNLYPGIVFNFAAFVGSMISLITGTGACFLIAKKIQNQSENNEHPFSLSIKKGTRSSGKLIFAWNLKIMVGSIILMAIFSYKTNLIAFALQPIYNLLNIEMQFNGTISSIAYALLVGSIGSIIFEVIFIKYILIPVTSPELRFINMKKFNKLFSKLKFINKLEKTKLKNKKKTFKNKLKDSKN